MGKFSLWDSENAGCVVVFSIYIRGGAGPFSVMCDCPFLKSVICEKAKFNSVICDRVIFCDV